jgi:hypothetical protein
MSLKPNLIKIILSGMAIFVFIKIAITLFTIGNKRFDDIDFIYNMGFGAIVIIFIVYRVVQTTKANSPIMTKKYRSSPPRPDNKPLHPK